MAFYLITNTGYQHQWHVQGSKPKFPSTPYVNPFVVLFQADGDELELIRKRFSNLPITFSITIWRGEMAQFIYDNL